MFAKKKMGFGALAAIVILSLLVSACSKSTNNEASSSNNPESQTATNSASENNSAPVKFKMLMVPDPRVEDITTNDFTKYLEESQNIKIDWMTVASADDLAQKKNLMMSTGDYPEIMMVGFTPAEQFKYGKDGLLVPLNDLIDQYAPHIKEYMEQNEAYKIGVTGSDGNIYALSAKSDCFHCSLIQKAWINKKWLDNLGLPIPTTTEQFYETLKAFKEQDPNQNGTVDEIPMTGAVGTWYADVDGFLMNPFILDNRSNYLEVREGKITFVADQAEYRAGLAYMNKLYKEKLLDPAAFTQNLDSLNQIMNSADQVGVYTAGHIAMGILLESPNYKDWVALPPLEGPEGKRETGYFPSGYNGGGFSITNKASEEQKIAAIKMYDYLMTEEGTMRAKYGQEGEFWFKPEAGEKDFNGNPAKYKENPEMRSDQMVQNKTWHDGGSFGFNEALRSKAVAPEDKFSPDAYEYRLYSDTRDSYEPYQPKEALPVVFPFTPEEQDQVALLQTEIQKYVQEFTVRFVTGDKSLDSGWDSYVAGFDKLKVKDFVNLYQQAFDRIGK